MIPLCSTADVLARPSLTGRALTAQQTAALPGYIEESSLLVQAYLEHTYVEGVSIPGAARIVTARVVARVLTSPSRAAELETYNSSMGAFGHSAHVAADAIGGGVWLTKADKSILGHDRLPARDDVAQHDRLADVSADAARSMVASHAITLTPLAVRPNRH